MSETRDGQRYYDTSNPNDEAQRNWGEFEILKAENAKLKEAIQSALSIKALWLHGEVSLLASNIYRDEARALAMMAERFEQALKEKP